MYLSTPSSFFMPYGASPGYLGSTHEVIFILQSDNSRILSHEGGSTMFMFERPQAPGLKRNGPLAEERRRYLVHCAERQLSP